MNCRPIASLDHFVPEALGSADLVEEIHTGPSKIVKVCTSVSLLLSAVYEIKEAIFHRLPVLQNRLYTIACTVNVIYKII